MITPTLKPVARMHMAQLRHESKVVMMVKVDGSSSFRVYLFFQYQLMICLSAWLVGSSRKVLPQRRGTKTLLFY